MGRIALLYFALTLLLAYPLTTNPAGSVMSVTPDTDLFIWTLSWDTHALRHQLLSMFDANIYYPRHHTLAYSENLIGSALLAAPILWITDNPVLAMNVVALVSCVVCGLGAYVLARRVGVGWLGAALSGLVFAFSPPRFLRLDQLHLTTIQWVPFGLAALHTYLDDGRRFDLRLAATFFTLQAFTSGHGAVLLSAAMLSLVGYRVALGEPIALTKRARDLGLAGALLLLPTAVIFLPYRSVQVEMGLRRSLEDSAVWAVTLSSFLASPAYVHTYLLSFFPAARINETAQAYLFPGYLPLLLAGAAFVGPTATRRADGPRPRHATFWTRTASVIEAVTLTFLAVGVFAAAFGAVRLKVGTTVLLSLRHTSRVWLFCAMSAGLRIAIARRAPFDLMPRLNGWLAALRRWAVTHRQDSKTYYGLLTLACVWISIGPPLGLWPLVYWLPVLDFIRVPSRFTLLALLGLAVLAGIGFERSSARLAPRNKVILATIVGGFLVAEFMTPLATTPYRVEIPDVDRWLAHQPGPFAVAEIPLPNPNDLGSWERRETAYMLHSMAHWQKTVHGYSGFRPPMHAELYLELTRFPDQNSLRTLTRLGVAYVVVHTDLYPTGEWDEVQRRIGQFREWLKLERVDGAGRVYSLRRPPDLAP